MRSTAPSDARFQFMKFLAVGLLNTAFGYALYALFVLGSLLPEIALALATIIGAIFNYVTTGRIVFAERSARKIPLFLLTYASIYVVNAASLRILISQELSPFLAQAILLPFVTVISFLTFRHLIFRTSHPS